MDYIYIVAALALLCGIVAYRLKANVKEWLL